MSAPRRIRRQRTKGWRMPEGAVYVGRGSVWGNPFRYRDQTSGLVREPGIMTGHSWEYEGRISANGTRHDFHHADGAIDVVHVRWATRTEIVELYRQALARQENGAFRMAWGPRGWPLPVGLGAEMVRRELAGRDLACWCDLTAPCHADVLLEVANTLPALSEAARA